MGITGSSNLRLTEDEISSSQSRETTTNGSSSSVWTTAFEDSKFLNDPNLPDVDDVSQYLELLKLLRDAVGQRHIGSFAKKSHQADALMCFVDIEEFASIPTTDYRRSKANHIYNKYVKVGSVLELGLLSPDEREALCSIIQSAKEDLTILESWSFALLQKRCFLSIFNNTFLRFKQDETAWTNFMNDVSNTYNNVKITDFEFFEKLGEGAFGRVVHVRKKTTGKHYAMKIQPKKALLKNCQFDKDRLMHERRVLAKTEFPYILGLDYALLTDFHAIFVTTLVMSGTLQDAIDDAPNGRLPIDRVQFYTAEVVLSLCHMHDMGLMYRDLKPRNVLLQNDGHVLLADMGAVADFWGEVLDVRVRKTDSRLERCGDRSSFSKQSGRTHSIQLDPTPPIASPGSKKTREGVRSQSPEAHINVGQSIIGPSIITSTPSTTTTTKSRDKLEQTPPIASPTGRSSPVRTSSKRKKKNDHFADDVNQDQNQAAMDANDSLNQNRNKMTRKSIMGTRGYMAPEMIRMMGQPHELRQGYSEAVDWWSLGVTVYKMVTGKRPFQPVGSGKSSARRELESIMMQDIDFPDYVPDYGFLEVNETSRLGVGVFGRSAMMNHEFFEGIDWDKLSQKHVIPPFIPNSPPLIEVPLYTSYEEMMGNMDRDEEAAGRQKRIKWNEPVTDEEDACFLGWEYVSPRTIRIEMGLATEMDTLDSNFKVRQLTGEAGISSRKSMFGK